MKDYVNDFSKSTVILYNYNNQRFFLQNFEDKIGLILVYN